MKTESISEVVERAIEWTGMKRVPVKLRARLVSDNGPSYVALAFEELPADAPDAAHPLFTASSANGTGNSNGFHETLKARDQLLVWTSPEELREAIAGVHRVLQPETLPRRKSEMSLRRRVLRPAGRNPETQGGTKTAGRSMNGSSTIRAPAQPNDSVAGCAQPQQPQRRAQRGRKHNNR